MYVKIFAQMYDGTLCTAGPWQALVTFQQLLILADTEGVVDMTAVAIHRRTTVPLDIIEKGLAALMLPDPDSRTPVEDGRRIVPVSEGRSWGWRVVNYEHYRKLKREEDRREYHRAYWHKRKGKQADPLNNTQHNSTDTTESTYSISRSICNKDQELLETQSRSNDAADAEISGKKPRRKREDTGDDPLCDLVRRLYDSTLPKCRAAGSLTPKRKKRIHEADKMAKDFCKSHGWEYVPAEFWGHYFGECLGDPWLRGDTVNPNNPSWKQNIDLLLDEKRFTQIMDGAVTKMRESAHG